MTGRVMIRLLRMIGFFGLFAAAGMSVPQDMSSRSQQIVNLPLPEREQFKPKILLPDALKLADRFIKKNKIDLSSHYLSEARLIWNGSHPYWFLCWIYQNRNRIYDVEISVLMDGSVRRMPAMQLAGFED